MQNSQKMVLQEMACNFVTAYIVQVKKLQGVLDGEQALNRVLRFALEGPVSSHPSLSSVVPPEVRAFVSA